MKSIVLLLCLINIASCKQRINKNNSNIRNSAANTNDIKTCSGKIDDEGKFGFKFKSESINFANSYWLGLASMTAYKNKNITQENISKWTKANSIDFQYFGNDSSGEAESSRTQGMMINLPQGSILAFRGTAGIGDLLTDAKVSKVGSQALDESSTLFAFGDLKIHSGFWHALDEVSDWKNNGQKIKLWDLIVSEHILNAPIVTYDLNNSIEKSLAFKAMDRVLLGILHSSDTQETKIDSHYALKVKDLIKNGIIKPSNEISIEKMTASAVNALNIWNDASTAITKAHINAMGDEENQAYKAILKKESLRLMNQFEILHQHWVYRNYRPIWITGHSLGGALATVATYRLINLGVPVQGLVTFGSPRAGNRIFTDYITRRFIREGLDLNLNRFQNNNDGVSRIPNFLNWSDLGAPYFINEEQELLIPSQTPLKKVKIAKGLTDFVTEGVNLNFYSGNRPENYRGFWTFALENFVSDHSMANQYLEHLKFYAFSNHCNEQSSQ